VLSYQLFRVCVLEMVRRRRNDWRGLERIGSWREKEGRSDRLTAFSRPCPDFVLLLIKLYLSWCDEAEL
jgi:hypothetical protein